MIAHNSRILVVDDDKSVRKGHERLLRSMGYTVETAENGKEALWMLVTREFGCVISDYSMPPGMTGYGLLVEVREHLAQDTPFILTSSQMDDHLRTRALQAGANACLAKESITPELLGEIFQKI